MNPQDLLNLLEKEPPIVLRDPLHTLWGLAGPGDLVATRLVEVLTQPDLFHPHAAAAFHLCRLAVAALEEMLEAPVNRAETLVVVRGQERDLSNGLMARVFAQVLATHGEGGFKGYGPRHRRRRRLWFEQEEFDYNTFDVIHWPSGAWVRVRFEPEELPYSVPLNNLVFAMETRDLTDEEQAQFARLWAMGIYDALFSPEAKGDKVYFCQPGRGHDHPLRHEWLRTLADPAFQPQGQGPGAAAATE